MRFYCFFHLSVPVGIDRTLFFHLVEGRMPSSGRNNEGHIREAIDATLYTVYSRIATLLENSLSFCQTYIFSYVKKTYFDILRTSFDSLFFPSLFITVMNVAFFISSYAV